MFQARPIESFPLQIRRASVSIDRPGAEILKAMSYFSARIAVGSALRRSLAAQSRLRAAVVFFRSDVWNIDPVRDCG